MTVGFLWDAVSTPNVMTLARKTAVRLYPVVHYSKNGVKGEADHSRLLIFGYAPGELTLVMPSAVLFARSLSTSGAKAVLAIELNQEFRHDRAVTSNK